MAVTNESQPASLFDAWPHAWYGWFGVRGYAVSGIPTFSESQDLTWQPSDKSLLVTYLISNPICIAAVALPIRCQHCGAMLDGPGTWYWDNTWLWPRTLAHFVDKHHVRLPDGMVSHIRASGYGPVERKDCDFIRGQRVLYAIPDEESNDTTQT